MTRFVGGAVRDMLLGVQSATSTSPRGCRRKRSSSGSKRRGIKAVPTGIEHGTITAVADGQPVEVTTLRADVSTDGRRATVAFTDDWKADAGAPRLHHQRALRRPRNGEMFDYFGGLDDLEAAPRALHRRAPARIAEDHLRILRFFRFHARYGHGGPTPQPSTPAPSAPMI